jgi:hypothetical protein
MWLAARVGMNTHKRAVQFCFVVALGIISAEGRAAEPVAVVDVINLPVHIGPVAGKAATSKVVSLNLMARKKADWFDVQDGLEHHVRGVTLAELTKLVKPPKEVDAVVFSYTDGMQIPVRLDDREEADAIFVALEHGDPMDVYRKQYELRGKPAILCPKIVYGRNPKDYSIWLFPSKLERVSFVSFAAYEATLAQPTRRFPDRSGWPIYMKHCQPCHGLGGQGAKRGSDFLADLDAYRRIPPLAVTDLSQHPSLHEKVKGFAEGTMPVLNHVSNQEIATLWRWLHTIHRAAIK